MYIDYKKSDLSDHVQKAPRFDMKEVLLRCLMWTVRYDILQRHDQLPGSAVIGPRRRNQRYKGSAP